MSNYVICYYDFGLQMKREYKAKAMRNIQEAQAAFGDFARLNNKRVKAYEYFEIVNRKRKRILI